MKTRNRQPGRGWSTFGFAIGIAASIAANVAHSYVRPAHAVAGWVPQPGAIVAAAFWPVALVISIEVISRVQWPHRWYWGLIRYVGLSAVAFIAAIISYGHLSALMRFYGEDTLSATIGPLAVDGLMVVCSGALLAIGDNVRRADEIRKAVADLDPETRHTVSDLEAAEYPEYTGDRAPRRAQSAPKPRAPRSDSKAAKVARTAARMPAAKPAAIAVKAGVSETTVRRHLSTARPDPAMSAPALSSGVIGDIPAHLNGTDVLADISA